MTDTLIAPGGAELGRRPSGLGRVFFVDQVNGLNTNNGVDPGTPFETITYALTQCLADREDYIYVLQHGAAWAEPAGTLTIDINRVHLIGRGRHGPDQVMRMHGDGNDVFSITGRDVEIAGFGFDTIGQGGHGIINAGALFGAWIHHCHFAGSSLGNGLDDAINGTFPWALIEDNVFNSPNGVGLLNHSIVGGIQSCTIRRNYFVACHGGASECIHITNVEIGVIVDNYFYCPISDTGAVGWAIFLEAIGMEGGPITNNHAMQTGDGTGLNPYRDTSSPGDITAVSHGWGMNYSGQAVVTPAVA